MSIENVLSCKIGSLSLILKNFNAATVKRMDDCKLIHEKENSIYECLGAANQVLDLIKSTPFDQQSVWLTSVECSIVALSARIDSVVRDANCFLLKIDDQSSKSHFEDNQSKKSELLFEKLVQNCDEFELVDNVSSKSVSDSIEIISDVVVDEDEEKCVDNYFDRYFRHILRSPNSNWLSRSGATTQCTATACFPTMKYFKDASRNMNRWLARNETMTTTEEMLTAKVAKLKTDDDYEAKDGDMETDWVSLPDIESVCRVAGQCCPSFEKCVVPNSPCGGEAVKKWLAQQTPNSNAVTSTLPEDFSVLFQAFRERLWAMPSDDWLLHTTTSTTMRDVGKSSMADSMEKWLFKPSDDNKPKDSFIDEREANKEINKALGYQAIWEVIHRESNDKWLYNPRKHAASNEEVYEDMIPKMFKRDKESDYRVWLKGGADKMEF